MSASDASDNRFVSISQKAVSSKVFPHTKTPKKAEKVKKNINEQVLSVLLKGLASSYLI